MPTIYQPLITAQLAIGPPISPRREITSIKPVKKVVIVTGTLMKDSDSYVGFSVS